MDFAMIFLFCWVFLFDFWLSWWEWLKLTFFVSFCGLKTINLKSTQNVFSSFSRGNNQIKWKQRRGAKRIRKLVTVRAHLNMKMNRISNEKKIATLSIVLSMTNNWRRRFGMKRTNLRIRNNRNVRSTDKPEFPLAPSPPTNAWHNSTALKRKKHNDETREKEEENLC